MTGNKNSLNKILANAGIVTLYLNKPKSNIGTHLVYNGKTIERPRYNHCHDVCIKEFGIDLNNFDY